MKRLLIFSLMILLLIGLVFAIPEGIDPSKIVDIGDSNWYGNFIGSIFNIGLESTYQTYTDNCAHWNGYKWSNADGVKYQESNCHNSNVQSLMSFMAALRSSTGKRIPTPTGDPSSSGYAKQVAATSGATSVSGGTPTVTSTSSSSSGFCICTSTKVYTPTPTISRPSAPSGCFEYGSASCSKRDCVSSGDNFIVDLAEYEGSWSTPRPFTLDKSACNTNLCSSCDFVNVCSEPKPYLCEGRCVSACDRGTVTFSLMTAYPMNEVCPDGYDRIASGKCNMDIPCYEKYICVPQVGCVPSFTDCGDWTGCVGGESARACKDTKCSQPSKIETKTCEVLKDCVGTKSGAVKKSECDESVNVCDAFIADNGDSCCASCVKKEVDKCVSPDRCGICGVGEKDVGKLDCGFGKTCCSKEVVKECSADVDCKVENCKSSVCVSNECKCKECEENYEGSDKLMSVLLQPVKYCVEKGGKVLEIGKDFGISITTQEWQRLVAAEDWDTISKSACRSDMTCGEKSGYEVHCEINEDTKKANKKSNDALCTSIVKGIGITGVTGGSLAYLLGITGIIPILTVATAGVIIPVAIAGAITLAGISYGTWLICQSKDIMPGTCMATATGGFGFMDKTMLLFGHIFTYWEIALMGFGILILFMVLSRRQ